MCTIIKFSFTNLTLTGLGLNPGPYMGSIMFSGYEHETM